MTSKNRISELEQYFDEAAANLLEDGYTPNEILAAMLKYSTRMLIDDEEGDAEEHDEGAEVVQEQEDSDAMSLEGDDPAEDMPYLGGLGPGEISLADEMNELRSGLGKQSTFEDPKVFRELVELFNKSRWQDYRKQWREKLKTEEHILQKIPEHAATWVEQAESDDELDSAISSIYIYADRLAKSYVALLNSDGLSEISLIVNRVAKIIPEKWFPLTGYEAEHQEFLSDLYLMKGAYTYLRENPGTSQSSLYYKLGLPGKRFRHYFEYAERFEIVGRKKHKASWLLTMLEDDKNPWRQENFREK